MLDVLQEHWYPNLKRYTPKRLKPFVLIVGLAAHSIWVFEIIILFRSVVTLRVQLIKEACALRDAGGMTLLLTLRG